MDIEIDVGAAEPVYEQIVHQIQQGVQNGALAPGLALPPIRQLAHDLDLNHNTVAKAYKILEAGRVIRTAGQKGTFINDDAAVHIAQRNEQEAAYLAGTLAKTLRTRGLSLPQIQAAFERALHELSHPTPRQP